MAESARKCLFVHELLAEVVRNLSRDTDRLHVALACRAFYEAAMDELWRCPRDVLLKLMACLPPDIACVEQHSGPFVDAETTNALYMRWDRFKHHAKRVRTIELSASAVQPASRGKLRRSLAVLAGCFPSPPVLPNLKKLHMDPECTVYAHLFLTPDLEEFGMSWHTSESIQTVMPRLTLSCAPTLRHLSLRHLEPDIDSLATRAHEDFLLSCRNLVSLETSIPFRLTTFAKLATLPSLKKVTVYSPFLQELDVPSQIPEHMLFSAMMALDLMCTAQDILRSLRAASMPLLQHLELGINSENTITSDPSSNPQVSAHGVAQVIALLPKFVALQWVNIFPLFTKLASLLLASTLFLLTTLLNLEVLIIHEFHFDLHPGDVVAMARAWPHLRCLNLGANAEDTPEAQPSICVEDLHPLAQHCSELVTLQVLVAGSSVLRREPLAADDLGVHTQLLSFSLGPSRIYDADDQDRVAQFVLSVFPEAQFKAKDEQTFDGVNAALTQRRRPQSMSTTRVRVTSE